MWSRFRIELAGLAAIAGALSGCGGTPSTPAHERPAEVKSRPEPAARADETAASAESQETGETSVSAVVVEVPPRAAADFARAVTLMRSGNAGEAELEFQQLAAGYPRLAGPHANLGLLHRKAGRLDPAIAALRAAAERNPASAVVWTELGVTLRMRGEFQDAAVAYERAIGVDPAFAPAHRNLGVLRDLYLGDASGALAAFEQYKSLTGEDKPVSGWIAELRQRTGTAAPPPPPSAPVHESAPQSGGGV